jgi:hypothetical protein
MVWILIAAANGVGSPSITLHQAPLRLEGHRPNG